MIEVRNLDKRYGSHAHAVNRISFTLDKKITSIIGQNGAGKTTLLRILSTQLLPTSGTASINGYDIIKDAAKIRDIAVSIPQESRPISWFSPTALIMLYLGARGMNLREAREAAEKAIKKVGLWESRDKLAAELSGGMKRKIFVAMALASNADIIFLDEPTTGLDPLSRIQIWSAIRSMKGQVIITTHYMEEAQALSNDVLMMNKGRVLSQGSVNELLKPFEGMVRVESKRKKRRSHKVGDTWVSYVKKRRAESFVMEGDIIKSITLDDLFIKEGVNLES